MSLTLANSLIRAQDLSQITRQALSLVDGGLPWVQWASDATFQRYSFTDETTLVGAVQRGLHGTSLAYLPRCQVFISPVKLMTMGLEDLKRICQWESSSEEVLDARQIESLFEGHDVVACPSLKSPFAVLEELGVGESPLFANLSLIEHLEVRQWSASVALQDEPAQRLAKEAAQFALQQARQALDFIDYYGVYISLAEREPGGSGLSTDQRLANSESVLHALLPELFAYLDCPQTRGLPSPAEALAVVKEWLANGQSLGFSRLSSGVRQIVATPSFRADPATIAASVRSYVMAANQFFSRQQQLASIMKQDGCSCCYRSADNEFSGELLLNAEHVISLQSLQSLPSSTTPEGQP